MQVPSVHETIEEVIGIQDTDIEAALDPVEPDGVFRDSRECAALALEGGAIKLLLSPPTPRPKKG
ncbi:hypothetical protein [Streptomyces sp. JB150]|uniref:hypothetical protein n=1 Tax=Streptomyces sp. JB150 TaxID=2714844 RepID=UPI00140DD754|nr:hypothetical protein [Streptomyces sp. JB150]QIJ66817.1 hypothetical protein G7Z13_29405 [Streptomyces sp. JB150]